MDCPNIGSVADNAKAGVTAGGLSFGSLSLTVIQLIKLSDFELHRTCATRTAEQNS